MLLLVNRAGKKCRADKFKPMHDLIFLSLENWDDIWRRNQFLCAAYARRYPQSKILFVGLARDVSHHVRRGTPGALRGQATRTLPDLPNITITQPLKLFPNTLAAGRSLNERAARSHIRGVARQLKLDAPLLWLNPHDAVHMAGKMGERRVIYDITDDWTTPTQSSALTRRIVAQDSALCRRADAVIVCSEKLYDLKRDLARSLYLIPNGVDAAHYSRVLDGTGPLPALAAGWRKPVLGYTGTLHPDRIDIDLVEAVARAFPNATLALVGPNFLPAGDQARLDSLSNIVVTGPQPYAVLPDIMRAFDVCITPHRVTPFTESLNPIKLWEYLAAGKPIVSTNVAGFRDYPQQVRLAHSTGEFVAGLCAALEEGRDVQEARRAQAAPHSWEARLDALLPILQGPGGEPQ